MTTSKCRKCYYKNDCSIKNKKSKVSKDCSTQSESGQQTQSLNFSSLSPLDDVDTKDKKIKVYHDALDFALVEDSIHNIAITGFYGSGKSTVIDSYFKDKCKNEILKISLATFSINNNDKKTDTIIPEIEKSILQQMFYRKDANFLPFSRFKRIKSYDKPHILFSEICVITTILFFCQLLKPELINSFFTFSSLKEIILKFAFSVGFLIMFFFLTIFILKVKLTKFSFQKIELGLAQIDNESLLNKYIDELLYFFEKTNFKTVIFEDLDRFENPEIFYNLRELNSLINNYEKISHKVVFIYALRDEVFDDKSDRTKFFDFIIPIVPVMDFHNSKAILFDEDIIKKVDRTFLEEVSCYIDDKRLLKNCLNEFQLFDAVIASGNKTKLFALILYKNFYPKDFAKLNKKIEEIIEGKIVKSNSLEFILIPKYIDKDYIYNISRFYSWEDDTYSNDKQFIILLKEDKEPNFDLKLNDKENVFSEIKNNNEWWNNRSILNNDLLDYLLERKIDLEDDLERFISTMYTFDNNHPTNRFFPQYENSQEELVYFYNSINKYILIKNREYETFFKDNYEKLLQFFLSIQNIENEKFKSFIKQNIDFINKASETEIDNIILRLKTMNILINIYSTNINSIYMKKIIDEELFEITRENLEYIIYFDKQDFNRLSLFTEIKASNSIKDTFITKNLNQIIDSVLDIDQEVEENEESIQYIINNKNIDIDKRKAFIRQNKTQINSLSIITEQEILFELINDNRVFPTWNNILSVREKCGINDYLKDFIIRNLDILRNDKSITKDIIETYFEPNDKELKELINKIFK